MADPGTPSISSPRDGAAVDGMSCTLSWEAVPGSVYRVQVSANDRFDALLVDAETNDSTALTLYDLLPRDGRRLHWRVEASRPGGPAVWSDPTWFLSADVEDRTPAPPAVRPVSVMSRPAARVTESSEPVPPYLEDTTGSTEVLVASAVIVLTLVLFLLVAF